MTRYEESGSQLQEILNMGLGSKVDTSALRVSPSSIISLITFPVAGPFWMPQKS